jgi:hypothetical protein
VTPLDTGDDGALRRPAPPLRLSDSLAM